MFSWVFLGAGGWGGVTIVKYQHLSREYFSRILRHFLTIFWVLYWVFLCNFMVIFFGNFLGISLQFPGYFFCNFMDISLQFPRYFFGNFLGISWCWRLSWQYCQIIFTCSESIVSNGTCRYCRSSLINDYPWLSLRFSLIILEIFLDYPYAYLWLYLWLSLWLTRGQFRGRLLIFSARSFKVLGIRY